MGRVNHARGRVFSVILIEYYLGHRIIMSAYRRAHTLGMGFDFNYCIITFRDVYLPAESQRKPIGAILKKRLIQMTWQR
jgi:hypothetical protein